MSLFKVSCLQRKIRNDHAHPTPPQAGTRVGWAPPETPGGLGPQVVALGIAIAAWGPERWGPGCNRV